MPFRVILFVLTRFVPLLGDAITTTEANTDFVDVLRQDLRRNNDDYLDSTISVKVPNPYLFKADTKQLQNNTNETPFLDVKQDGTFTYRRVPQSNKLFVDTKNEKAAQRRVFDSLEVNIAEAEPLPPNKTEIIFKKAIPSARSQIFVFNTTTRSMSTIPLMNETFTIPVPTPRNMIFKKQFFRSKISSKSVSKSPKPSNMVTKETAKDTKNAKADLLVEDPNFRSHHQGHHQHEGHTSKDEKMQSFIQKNKKLFQEFVQMKRKEAEKGVKKPMAMYVTLRGKSSENVEMQDDDEDSDGQMKMRAAQSYEVTSLKPDQLDMAPAKGGKIHNLRVKGRLCQRHILIPEGPKYNSRGHAYVGAYGHARGHDFARTSRPRLLLPRCCNCCKKSVLGCE